MTRYEVTHYTHRYGGQDVPNTRHELSAVVWGQPVALVLLIAWGIDKRLMASDYPGYPGSSPIFNICLSFKLWLPTHPTVELTRRTLVYFDGAPHSITRCDHGTAILCHNKWRSSATGIVNRRSYFWGQAHDLYQFMSRRLSNAYGV